MDDDEDDSSTDSFAMEEDLSSDESMGSSSSIAKVRKGWQDKFQCMEKSDGTTNKENPNKRTIEILEEMRRYYDQMHDSWRTIAYRKAITTLRQQTQKITTKEQASDLRCIGPRLAAKIEEIVQTDRLQRLENARAEPGEQSLRLFLGIYGVGLAQASKWVERGFKTLADLQNNAKLTENQRIGIKHYEDFGQRIPRTEVEEHGRIVKNALKEINSVCESIIMGSFRRGAADSGDIDIVFTKEGANLKTIREIVFDKLVPKLFEQGFLKCALATSSRYSGDGSKWHGASCLPGSKVWRRIDFLLVPWAERGAAMIYFTGNDIFNRSIRLLASRKGMRLNQRGLYKEVMRGPGRQKVTQGELVEAEDEKRIFEILGVPWRPPHHRIC